jgi:mono/diheme cytochrome c family protein
MNCAHCHNPNGWDKSTQRRFDFRYETPLGQTGILRKEQKIVNTMIRGKMPFIGTTMLDSEGISLLREFTESL